MAVSKKTKAGVPKANLGATDGATAAATKSPAMEHIIEGLRPLAVPIGDIHEDPRNARTHDDANLKAIAASLDRYGQLKPLVVNRRNRQIEAGNGTYRAAMQLGWTHLAVVWVEHDESAQRGFSLADNRTAELADWDQAILDDLLAETLRDDADLYADLLLADLESEIDADEEDESDGKDDVADRWGVYVDCRDEKQQRTLLEQLTAEGFECRGMTS